MTLIVPLKATTTVAVVANGAVVVGVDSRASMGTFVGSHTTLKVIEHVYIYTYRGWGSGGVEKVMDLTQKCIHRCYCWCRIYVSRNTA